MAELLSCPFCGGEAEFVEGADDDGQWVAIGCPDCGAGSRQHYAVMEDPRPHAQSAWNTRASTQPAPVFPREEVAEAIRQAKVEADKVYGVAWYNLEEISRVELILAALLQGKQP